MATHRRSFLKAASTGAALTAAVAPVPAVAHYPPVRWRLASSFPKALDTIYGGAEYLAERLAQMSDGRFLIGVAAAGEIAPALKVLDVVQDGRVECGHTASYYFVAKNKAFAFDCALPFGLTARQQNAWMYFGGGLQVLREFFADYNIVNFPGGNTGTQMGGWFRNEIKSLADLKGVKMRIPGLGAEIMSSFGVVPQTLAAGDIYPALEKGAIDAVEWVGPHDDEKLGLYKIARHYYYPGWWEPETQLSFYVNKDAWGRLPKVYQEMFRAAAAEVNTAMVAEYDAKNQQAIVRLLARGVKLHRFAQEIMLEAQKRAFEIYEDEARKNPAFRKIYGEWAKFRGAIQLWHGLAEHTLENFMYSSAMRK